MSSGDYSRAGIDEPVPTEGYQKIVEGYAAVLFPPGKAKPGQEQKKKSENDAADDGQCVFYNPAQVVNRDLSVCAIETFSRMRPDEKPRQGGTKDGITILEALSATGLRAVRYWKEISGVKKIIANDIDADAVKLIKENCEYNKIPEDGIICNEDDAVVLMQRLALDPHAMNGQKLVLMDKENSEKPPRELLQQEKMDVVDLDPYGTATPFLDSAVSCAKEGAFMLVTCTDSNILCGNYPEKCFGNYNGIGVKGEACHEMAVRLVLASIERVANKHSRYIVPVLSLHIDFYVRVFFRIYTQPAAVKMSCLKLGNLYKCTRCPCFKTKPIAQAKPSRAQKKRMRGGNAKTETNDSVPAPDTTEQVEEKKPLEVASFPTVPHFNDSMNITCNTLEGIASNCEVCGGRVYVAGPIYCGPTHNKEFLQKLLGVIDEKHAGGHITARDRIRGLVCAAMDELPECPMFYNLPEVSSICRVPCPQTPLYVCGLAKQGYRCSQVHCDKAGFKTDAPPHVVIGTMLAYREFIGHVPPAVPARKRKEGGKGGKNKKPIEGEEGGEEAKDECDLGADARDTLRVEPIPDLAFHYDKQYDFRSKATGITKFIPNAPGWGPKARHTGIKEE